MTPEAAQAYPEILRQLGDELPDVLLGYQQRLLATTAVHQVTVCEKSRRIGVTWAIAADGVLTSAASRLAGGMDTLYIGYNLDMAREFIDACAMWARAFNHGAADVEEFIFKDNARDGERDIKAFRIEFASGFEIVALTAKPRSLRGRQGYLIFDEAAFHDDLPGMLKAGLAFLMWGGKILVISTHDGEANPFAELVNDCRAGRKPYALVRTTFDDAVADGLYERIRLMMEARGLEIEPREEWTARIRTFYGEDAAEELDVIPGQGTGTAIPGALIEMRMDAEIPVLRWEAPDSFAREPEHMREAEAADWCEAHLKPLLANLDPRLQSFFGEDFGRVRDLTVIWPVQLRHDLVRRPPFVVELRNIPFEQQKQVLFHIVDRLPRLMAGALDATGNGAYLAEVAAQRYGEDRIAQVKFSTEWYRENMPPFRAAFEDGTVALPRDADVLADHRGLRKVNGVIQVPALRAQDVRSKDKKRHCDSAIAHALCHFASRMEIMAYGYAPAPRASSRLRESADDDDGLHGGLRGGGGRFGTQRGAW